MKFSVNIEQKCDTYLHQTIYGDAFAIDPRNRLVLVGGYKSTSLIDLNKPEEIIQTFDISRPLKWSVTSYEWDLFSSNESERYLQTRNKTIEIINLKSPETNLTLEGHAKAINQAKWAPLNRNIIASSSNDGYIMLWDIKQSIKPEIKISSIGEIDCLAWNKSKENIIAASCNNDIKIYDLRMVNRAYKYLKSAHSKKIYSLDWSNTPSEEILLSSSKDRSIKLWNLNMLNEKFMERLIEDIPCWKSKFTPFNMSFGVIPTCQSNFTNQTFNHTIPNSQIKQDRLQKNETFLFTCQITGFNEAKINKIISQQYDMILDFDFYTHDELLNVVTWSRDQNLRIHGLDAQQFSLRIDFEKNLKTKNEDDLGFQSTNKQHLSALHQTTNTTNSSRKSSFSENLNGTSPNFTTYLPSRALTLNNERDSSINLAEEPLFLNEYPRPNSQNLNKPQSSTISPHDFLKKNPKCYGAKFSGLPEQFILYSNEGISVSAGKQKESDGTISTLKKSRNQGNANSNQLTTEPSKLQSSNSKNFLRKIRKRVVITDISKSLTVSRDLAEKYSIKSNSIGDLCDQNIQIAVQLDRQKIIKLWELLKIITFSDNKTNLQASNPCFGLPWSCSTFGRNLINKLIDYYVELNDIQTVAMIISKLKINDSCLNSQRIEMKSKSSLDINENPKNSSLSSSFEENGDDTNSSIFDNTEISEIESDELSNQCKNLGLLDPKRLKEFDSYLKTYCNLLYRWGLYNKRIEMLEFVTEKPKIMDLKYECFKRCVKCANPIDGPKCGKCNSYSIKCSLCELPVNGLALYCPACGCGGHYNHQMEWFKRHDDCASACGCRCIDYL